MLDANLKNAHILIVDDEPDSVEVLEVILLTDGYHQVRSTTDPRRVVDLFTAQPPDIILLDLRMPHLDGFQVLEKLRLVIPERGYLPIVVLTADISADSKRRALSHGATDFITKPYDHVEVLLRIHNLLKIRYLHLEVQSRNEMLEKELKARQRAQAEAHLLLHMPKAIKDAVDFTAALNAALQLIGEATGWTLGLAWLPGSDGKCLTASEAWWSSDHGDRKLEQFRRSSQGFTYAPGQGLAGDAWASRQAQWVPDLAILPQDAYPRTSLALEAGLRAGVEVPVVDNDRVLAILEFFLSEPRDEDHHLIGVVSAIATQLASRFSLTQRRDRHVRRTISSLRSLSRRR